MPTKAQKRRALQQMPLRTWWNTRFVEIPHHARAVQLDIATAGWRTVACPKGIGGRRGRKRRRAEQRLAFRRWAREQARIGWLEDDRIPF